MKYLEFKQEFQDRPFIRSRDVVREAEDPQVLYNQLTRWRKKGLLISLRRDVYVLNSSDRKVELEPGPAANILYEPSYVSLEYALNFYGLIPEGVWTVTSVTTQKTKRFQNAAGTFSYQHIQPKEFQGFEKTGEKGHSFFLALPEKAVVDFLYLNLGRFDRNAREVLEESYRFQNVETLDPEKLGGYAELFETKKLSRIAAELSGWIKEERV